MTWARSLALASAVLCLWYAAPARGAESDASREAAVLREIRKTEQREREEREEEEAERRTEREIMRAIVEDEVDEYDVDD